MLRATEAPLTEVHDLAMLDLDGVVYIGGHAVPGASEALSAARDSGLRLAFITNNASRTPTEVATHLTDLGVPAEPADVVTSAQAAARLLAARLPSGAAVFLVGARGLDQALREQGLTPVDDLARDPVAVVTGYGPDTPWRRIVQGGILIGRGLPWVATNTDGTIPTPEGVGPGNGVLVQMLADFTGVTPTVAGKPERPLFDETLTRVGGEHPLMVGDRIDTDILGARRAGIASLLVLTGVTRLAELAAATPDERPDYLSRDLSGLLVAQPAVTADTDGWSCGGWHSRIDDDGRLRLEGDGAPDDWWRAAAEACWAHLDADGEAADVRDATAPTVEPTATPADER